MFLYSFATEHPLAFHKILLLIPILFATAEKALSGEEDWREAKRSIKQ